ncbi:MAG: tRNA-guanine transglycosylase [Candidatus Bathyarchaeia archaeon]
MVREIRTPFLWFSQTINGVPKPWKHFEIDGLMVNAYEILQKNRASLIIKEKGIHTYLAFSGPIVMDSGGFLFMKKRILDVHPQKILELYDLSKPNFGVVLDHPLKPNLSNAERKKRQLKTLENTRYMVNSLKGHNPQLIPVIHGHSIQTILWYVKKLNQIHEFETYGIGSLVPSVFTSKDAGGIYNVARIVSFVRKLLPNKKIHVFGVGSALTMHLMFYLKADSVDSSGWRTKAAFGAIQLPRVGDRYITKKKKHKKYPDLSRSERETLDDCGCPVCRNYPLDSLKKSFQLRALHNAWVFQKEVETARKLITKNDYESYVKEVLTSTPFSNVFKYAAKLKGLRAS